MLSIVVLIGPLFLQLAGANACNGDCNCSATIISCKCQKGEDFIKPKNFSDTIPANITTLIVSNCNQVILDEFTFLNTGIDTSVVKNSNKVLVKSKTFNTKNKVDRIRFKDGNLTFEENAFSVNGKYMYELVLDSVQCEILDTSILGKILLAHVMILNSNLKGFNISVASNRGHVKMIELLISNSTLDELIITHHYQSGSVNSLKILDSSIKSLRKKGIMISDYSVKVEHILLDNNIIGLLENEFLTINGVVVQKFSFTNNLVESAEEGVFDRLDNLLYNIQIENNVFNTGLKRHWQYLSNGHMSISNNTFPCTAELCYEFNDTYPVVPEMDLTTHFDNLVYNNSKCLNNPSQSPFEIYGSVSDVLECLTKFNVQPDLQPNQTCIDGCVCNSKGEAICTCQSSKTFTPQLESLSSTVRNVIIHNCTTVVLEKASVGQTYIESLIVRDCGEVIVREQAFSNVAGNFRTVKFKNTYVTLKPMSFQTNVFFLDSIVFDNVNFKNLSSNAFSKIDIVKKLKILNSKIDKIQPMVLNESSVACFIIANSDIDTIESQGLRFEPSSGISKFYYIFNNTIRVMGEKSIDVYTKMTDSVRLLSIRKNKIGQMKTGALYSSFPGLDQLDFLENSVDKLDKNVFVELYKIRVSYLTISGNTFHSMEEQFIGRDKGMVVEGNKIACNAQLCTNMKLLFPSVAVETRGFFRNLVYDGATCVSDNRAIHGRKVFDLYRRFIDNEDCENNFSKYE